MNITDYLILVGLLLIYQGLNAIKGLLGSAHAELAKMNSLLQRIANKDSGKDRDAE